MDFSLCPTKQYPLPSSLTLSLVALHLFFTEESLHGHQEPCICFLFFQRSGWGSHSEHWSKHLCQHFCALENCLFSQQKAGGRCYITAWMVNFNLFAPPAVGCPPLSQPDNGHLSCSGGNQTFNSTCQFKCNSGFLMIGSSALTCGVTGVWSGPRPVCASMCVKLYNSLKPILTNKIHPKQSLSLPVGV